MTTTTPQTPGMKGPFSKPTRTALLLSLLLATIASLTYFVVIYRGASIPPMPLIQLTAASERQSVNGLVARTKTFRPTEREQTVIGQLEALHLAETSLDASPVPPAAVKRMVEDLTSSLSGLAAQDKPRFLILGDLLALRFDRALHSFLRELSNGRGSSAKTGPERSDSTMVTLYGGAFYTRALGRGVIRPDGRLNTPSITPQVLFRFRWRAMGGVSPTEGFSAAEQMAIHDFTARFADPTSIERRLAAADALQKLSADYDAIIAKALIALEANDARMALDILETARKEGRNDMLLIRFIRHLQRQPPTVLTQ